ncbi:penicillin amidase domain-containing protein [Cyclospora cayetanensis]|uniref:Penicillin amidase domain-containing protein n=1 Tax=Cyclospora cayetanensis TaxID=88456 RepID=A0A1D3CTR3_9EIME|nr:penicillin amidase domain-containing protein [Cyclospora cayetanensis]
MEFSKGMGVKSFLAAFAAGSLAFIDVWGYMSFTYTDFFSFVIGFFGRPILRHFFTPPEDFWNTPKEVEGLEAPIHIGRDSHGIPYLTASSRDDLCFGQGYLHAIERPFQVELLRLIAVGRSASVLGPSMTDTDMIARTVISEDAILSKLRRMPPVGITCVTEALKALPARPVEFVLLGHTPSLPYTTMDVAAVTTLLSLMLNRGLTRDFVSVHLHEALGDKAKLFSFGFPEGIPPLNVDGNRPSLYDLAGKPIEFPSVEKQDTEWASRGPHTCPEMTESPHTDNPEFGGPMHDRDTNPEITVERMRLFYEELQKNADSYYIKHPKPWEEGSRGEESNSFSLKFDGSNGWAVSGKFTKTGMPLVAGDPHVEVHAPGFWMPMWLKSDGRGDGRPLRAVGATAVGATGLFVGHNEHAAWTQTVAHTDIEDLYMIELNEEGTHYFYDGKKYPLKLIEHKIQVKASHSLRLGNCDSGGRPTPLQHIARYSHHGPIFSDVMPPLHKRLPKKKALVLASVATVRAPLPWAWAEKMLYGKTWKDYIEMGQLAQMNEFVAVWATKEGHIGASVTGAVPKRPYSPEPGYRNGSDSKQDWKGQGLFLSAVMCGLTASWLQGIVPQEEIPFVMNPKAGVVVAGNSLLSSDPKKVYGEVYVPGHRVRRAHQLLAELKKSKKIEVQDLIKMQEDQYSENGCEFKDFVLKEFLHRFDLKNNQKEAAAVCAEEAVFPYVARLLTEAMESWDCSMSASSYGASIYEVWLQMMLQEVFNANKWSNDALFTLVGGWLHPTWLPRTEALNHWRINLLSALKSKRPELTMTGLFCKSARATIQYLSARLGPAVEDWEWGKLRSRYVDHIFSQEVPVLRHLLSVGPLKWGGNFGTIKAHHFEPHILKSDDPLSGSYHHGLDTTSLRVVFDLKDWENSRWAYFPGVSGWVGSKHFGDTAELLVDGKAVYGVAVQQPPHITALKESRVNDMLLRRLQRATTLALVNSSSLVTCYSNHSGKSISWSHHSSVGRGSYWRKYEEGHSFPRLA